MSEGISTSARIIRLTSVLGLAVGALVLVGPVGQAVVTTCQASNLTTGSAPSEDLQGVINSASAGDRLQVAGVCVGGFTIGKSLRLVGEPTAETPAATLDGNDASPVLRLLSDDKLEVTLTDLTITRGSAQYGGGIRFGRGTVRLKGSTSVTENAALYGGGGISSRNGTIIMNGAAEVVGNTADSGGGIFTLRTVVLNDTSRVVGNTASYAGGGINNLEGTVTLHGLSAISNNIAGEEGGGIKNSRGTVVLSGSSTVVSNTAGYGGGIYNDGYLKEAIVTLSDAASVSGNSARAKGGGIYNLDVATINDSASVSANTARNGGGIYNTSEASLALSQKSSVSRNLVTGRGGGVFNSRGSVRLSNASVVWKNIAGLRGGGVFNDLGIVRLMDSARIVRNDPDNCVRC
jgi:predicted outer membrane repeat protein